MDRIDSWLSLPLITDELMTDYFLFMRLTSVNGTDPLPRRMQAKSQVPRLRIGVHPWLNRKTVAKLCHFCGKNPVGGGGTETASATKNPAKIQPFPSQPPGVPSIVIAGRELPATVTARFDSHARRSS